MPGPKYWRSHDEISDIWATPARGWENWRAERDDSIDQSVTDPWERAATTQEGTTSMTHTPTDPTTGEPYTEAELADLASYNAEADDPQYRAETEQRRTGRWADGGRSSYAERFYALDLADPITYYDQTTLDTVGVWRRVWLGHDQDAHLAAIADHYDLSPEVLMQAWVHEGMEKWAPSRLGEVPADGLDYDPAGMSAEGRRLHEHEAAHSSRGGPR